MPIAIVCMVGLDILVADTFTEKLEVPRGLSVTNSTLRGWAIPPTGLTKLLPVYAYFAAAVPALLLYVLLFMETEICQ